MCIFVDEWRCKFAGNEITLDICKTCIKARDISYKTKQDKALQKQKKRLSEVSVDDKTETYRSDDDSSVPSESVSDKTEEDQGFLDKLESSAKSIENKQDIEETGSKPKDTKGDSSSELLEPLSIIDMENFQGDVETLRNDPHKDTDDWLRSLEDKKRSFLRMDFPKPPAKLELGKEQKILVKARRTKKEFFFPPLPELNMIIIDDERVIAESGRMEIEEPDGEVITFSWYPDKLSDIYGSDINLIIETFASGDDGDLMNHVEIGGIRWRADLSDERSIPDKRGNDDSSMKDKSFSALMEEAW